MLMRIRSATSAVHGGLVKGGWAESQFDDCTMDNMIDRFRELIDNGFTGRKLRIRMDVDPRSASAPPAETEVVAVEEKKEETK
jgi:hypothetical protein